MKGNSHHCSRDTTLSGSLAEEDGDHSCLLIFVVVCLVLQKSMESLCDGSGLEAVSNRQKKVRASVCVCCVSTRGSPCG